MTASKLIESDEAHSIFVLLMRLVRDTLFKTLIESATQQKWKKPKARGCNVVFTICGTPRARGS
jgi:hypothetical protein